MDPFQTKSKKKEQNTSLFGADNADSIATSMKLKSSKKENASFATKALNVKANGGVSGVDSSATGVTDNNIFIDASAASNNGMTNGNNTENVDEMVEVSL